MKKNDKNNTMKKLETNIIVMRKLGLDIAMK